MATAKKSSAKKSASKKSSASKKASTKSAAKKAPAKKSPAKKSGGKGSGQACWPGFERVPGTEAGTKGSCEAKPHQTASEKKADSRAAAASKREKGKG